MNNKKTAKERFLDRFFGGVEDWDEHLAKQIEDGSEILQIQEEFGNATNSDLGREMWYSNDFFINSLILNFISDAITDAEDDLVDELKQIYVGMLGTPGVDVEALDMDEEFDGYLIKMHFEIDLQFGHMVHLASYFIYGMQLKDERERNNLLPKMYEELLYLIDKEALLKKLKENIQDDEQVDFNSPRLNIATDLFVAGMSFILGHEIGHHFLKHTKSNGRNIVSKFKPTDVTSNQLHLDEFAADNFGFDLLIRGMKKRNDSILFAPLIVILTLAIYDKTPEEPSETHPSFRARYLNLLSRVSEHNEEIALTLQQIFNDLATWINGNLGGYWKTEWWK